jgi:glycine cleavage system H protein
MNTGKNAKRELYYTNDHEWIDFQGSVAYVGVCGFKLKGIQQIDQLIFAANEGFKEQGEVIATIQYDDYQVPVHMPVNGKVISINDALLSGDRKLLLQQPENNGWVALIVPDQLQERTGLVLPEQYTFTTL